MPILIIDKKGLLIFTLERLAITDPLLFESEEKVPVRMIQKLIRPRNKMRQRAHLVTQDLENKLLSFSVHHDTTGD